MMGFKLIHVNKRGHWSFWNVSRCTVISLSCSVQNLQNDTTTEAKWKISGAIWVRDDFLKDFHISTAPYSCQISKCPAYMIMLPGATGSVEFTYLLQKIHPSKACILFRCAPSCWGDVINHYMIPAHCSRLFFWFCVSVSDCLLPWE